MAPALKSGGKCKVGEHDGLSRRKHILCSLEGIHTTLVALIWETEYTYLAILSNEIPFDPQSGPQSSGIKNYLFQN